MEFCFVCLVYLIDLKIQNKIDVFYDAGNIKLKSFQTKNLSISTLSPPPSTAAANNHVVFYIPFFDKGRKSFKNTKIQGPPTQSGNNELMTNFN